LAIKLFGKILHKQYGCPREIQSQIEKTGEKPA